MSSFVSVSTWDGVKTWVRSTEITQVYSDGAGGSVIEVRDDAQKYASRWRPRKVARKLVQWEGKA